MLSAAILTTPLGSLQLIARDGLLERIAFPGTHVERLPAGDTPVLRRAVAQLGEYFAGRRRAFDLPLAAAGTAFQETVWAALAAIPFGETRNYVKNVLAFTQVYGQLLDQPVPMLDAHESVVRP